MDILIHTLSGLSVGTAACGFVTEKKNERITLILLTGLAGAIPDIDAISLWSGFDSTFGAFFNLNHSGHEIYFGKFWYSHHAFMHSLLASILFGLIASIRPLIKKRRKRTLSVFILFLLAYNAHLIGDLPTPVGTWDGIAYFFPSPIYVGGTGATWWWNNYDIFLFLLVLNVINLIFQFVINKQKISWIKYSPVVLWFITFGLCFRAVQNRDINYNGERGNYMNFELHSKEYQKELLGNRVYNWMESFDNSMNLNF